jgi:hypothetical protein
VTDRLNKRKVRPEGGWQRKRLYKKLYFLMGLKNKFSRTMGIEMVKSRRLFL